MNNLRWREPWGGSMSPEDTGLCNRLFHWEIAYGLCKANDFKFNILLEENYWPELQYIELPYTRGVHHDELRDEKYNYVSSKFYKGTTPITYKKLKQMSDKKNYKLNISKDYYSNFGFHFIDEFSDFDEDTGALLSRPSQLITLQDQFLEMFIKKYTEKTVGLHIRRWPTGVFRDEDDVKGFRDGEPVDWEVDESDLLNLENVGIAGKPPDNLYFLKDDSEVVKERLRQLKSPMKDGKLLLQYSGDPVGYTAVNNSVYMYIMDEMLKINPNQKFYISSDVNKKNLKIFYDNYDIIDFDTMMNESPLMRRHFRGTKTLHPPEGFHQYVLKNVVDLFSLANSYFLIAFGDSTFSTFAQDYKIIPGIFPQDKFNEEDKQAYIKVIES